MQFSISHNSNWAWSEVHVEGCRAAERDVKGQPTSAYSGYSAEKIKAMRANPDEGTLKVHACAKPHLS